MAIKITYNNATISSIGRADDVDYTPDDRQELVKIIGGVTVEDYGVCADGEVISLSAVFSDADYATLKTYWSGRTLVTVELEDGTIINNARVVIRRTTYYDALLPRYKKVQLEVWRV